MVKNREDCCGERIKGAQNHVGDSKAGHGKDDPMCGTITDTRLGSVSTISCNGLKGRYVTIIIPGRRGILTLSQNLALGRPATQSSSLKEYGPVKAGAGNAVDGKCDGILDDDSCTHTKQETEPWWNVDLDCRHSVSTVIVKNREDSCGERIKGAQIHVGDSKAGHGKDDPICGTITDTAPGSLSNISCKGMEGRYVTITIPDREEYLTLCEVEVYGTPVGAC
ncbi:fucolectin-like [Caretta caretta]|uniref:fucolectin-like n=1 Tax=Caretta caretta TaxID=8467 RepID=UPI003F4B78DC